MVPDQSSVDTRTRVVGLLGDPGLPAEIAEHISGDLPEVLSRQAGCEGRWRAETASQELTLDEQGVLPMARIGREQKSERGWDLVVLITDLPRRAGTQPIVSDYASADGVALVSLPSLGAVGLVHRAREVITHLLADHLLNASGTPATAATVHTNRCVWAAP